MRIPVLPTILVLLAIAVLVRLGFWQLHRAHERDSLTVRYEQNARLPAVPLPLAAAADESLLFRRATATCVEVVRWRAVGGESELGHGGTRFLAECRRPAGPPFLVDAGVSQQPRFRPAWTGGPVEGMVVREPPEGGLWARLTRTTPPPRPVIVLERPAPGLEPSRRPAAGQASNTSYGYAVQWFLFALTGLTIYVLALLRRRRETPAAG